jgi:hypothetical protein
MRPACAAQARGMRYFGHNEVFAQRGKIGGTTTRRFD